MIKKSLIVGGVLAALLAFLFGTDAFSYVRTYGRRVQSAVKDAVPLDVELDRARHAVEDLLPNIRQNMHVVAEEEVEVSELRKQISETQANLAKQRDKIIAMRRDLDSGQEGFLYAGLKYTRDQVKTDLSHRFQRFQQAEDMLKSKQQILAAREKSLSANRAKLESMIATRGDLTVQVESLEARLRMQQAAQAASSNQFDDSQLARAQKMIGDLRKRLDVAQRVLDAEGNFPDLIPVDEAVSEDLLEQIDHHFGPKADEGSAPAAKGDSTAAL